MASSFFLTRWPDAGEDIDIIPGRATPVRALGGTLGSRITAIVFARFGGIHAFYFSLFPMTLLLVTLCLFRRETGRVPVGVPNVDLATE